MPQDASVIVANLSKLCAQANRQNEPLVEAIAREVMRLCQVVQELEQALEAKEEQESSR